MQADARTIQRRTLGVLSGAQVLGGLGVGANVAAGGLLAAQVAGTESVAGFASTTSVLGAALAAIPLAALTSARGRRHGLAAGLVVGSIGSVVVMLGARADLLVGVLLGTMLIGAAAASGLQSRFAATDLAQPEHRARALSIVVWATTIGSVLGPNLTALGSALAGVVGVPDLAGTYVISAVAFGLGAALIWLMLRPDPLLTARAEQPGAAAQPSSGPRMGLRERTRAAWLVVRENPDARLGLSAVALGHAAMVSVMVMTPVHMAHAEVAISVIGLVISVHILGMFALSPIVGWASDRFGRHRVLIVGAVALLLAAAIAGVAPAHHTLLLGTGLFLLGLGWSCNLVAGSTLLSESIPASSRQDVQGLSDLVMNLCAALAGALAGGIVALLSFGWLALLAGVIVLPLAAWALRLDPHRSLTG